MTCINPQRISAVCVTQVFSQEQRGVYISRHILCSGLVAEPSRGCMVTYQWTAADKLGYKGWIPTYQER